MDAYCWTSLYNLGNTPWLKVLHFIHNFVYIYFWWSRWGLASPSHITTCWEHVITNRRNPNPSFKNWLSKNGVMVYFYLKKNILLIFRSKYNRKSTQRKIFPFLNAIKRRDPEGGAGIAFYIFSIWQRRTHCQYGHGGMALVKTVWCGVYMTLVCSDISSVKHKHCEIVSD